AVGCVHSSTCDDGDACNGVETCNPVDGSCGPGTPLTCDDGDPCTDDACSSLFGCVFTPNTAPCDDNDACTANDTCTAGVCLGTPSVFCDDGNPCNGAETCDPTSGQCGVGVAPPCDDGNPCTDDLCSPSLGCYHADNTAPCNDGNLCTNNDTCAVGVCAGTPIDCNNNDLCDGVETCNPANGQCVPGTAPSCDDGNDCTGDFCDAALGCLHTNLTDPCDDGNPCTGPDRCGNGLCSGPAVDCNDGNFCNGSEVCDPLTGGCLAGAPPSCTDADDCTLDSCDAVANTCVHTRPPNYDTCAMATTFTGLNGVLATLQATIPARLGGSLTQQKLVNLLTRARDRVQIAASAVGRRKHQAMASAATRLAQFLRVLDRGMLRGNIDATLGSTLEAEVHPILDRLRSL